MLNLTVFFHKENLLSEPGKSCKKSKVSRSSGSTWRAAGENGSIAGGGKGYPIADEYLDGKIENERSAGALVGSPP